MFSLFRKDNSPVVKDIVYLDEPAHVAAVCGWLQQHPEGRAAMWFHNDLEKLKEAIPADLVHQCVLADRLAFGHPGENNVLFAAHYPLRNTELDLCRELGLKEMLVYTHLDSPFLKSFGGGHLKELMIKMGMNGQESLTHPMISKAFKNAQEKLAKHVFADTGARSEEEWLKLNIPGTAVD